MRVIIVGGGIGGLASAVALARVGIEAEVYERAPALEAIGAGLSLWSNAIKALRRIGLADAVVAAGSEIRWGRTRRYDGVSLGDTDVGSLSDAAGAPTVCVHRGDLQRILLGAIDPARVHTGRACTGYDETAHGVVVRFEDGSRVEGDVLVGADGIHSAVRDAIVGPTDLRYAGYTAYRGVARIEPALGAGDSLLALGRGSQVGVVRCGGGQVYWFATQNTAAGGTDKDVLGLFGDWCSPIPEVLRATDADAILRNDIVDREPIGLWGEGRATLLGDAIHPTTPNLGQGACQALEDAIVLADRLSRGIEATMSLRAYEDARRARTAQVTRTSWRMGKVLAVENRAVSWARDALMRRGFGHRAAARLFRDLLGYDPPELTPRPRGS